MELRTKAYYDNILMGAIAKTKAQMEAMELYNYLVEEYNILGNQDMKFLAEMPYEQGREWVNRAFALFMDLHNADPEHWPMQKPIDVVQTIRAYRKAQNKFKKTTPSPVPPTAAQLSWIESFGLQPNDWLVRKWTAASAILEHRHTREIREVAMLE